MQSENILDANNDFFCILGVLLTCCLSLGGKLKIYEVKFKVLTS